MARVSWVVLEIEANVAEFAAMNGLSFDMAMTYAARGLYNNMLACIHRGGK